MEGEQKCTSCGGVTVDQRDAKARLSAYLMREDAVSAPDAERRADDIVTLIGAGAGALTLAPIGALATNWWLFALRGVLAVVFGILALVQPVAALAALVLVFGVWAFIDGIDALALAVTGWRSWQLIVVGLVGIGVGIFTFVRPGITAIALYAAVAAWSIARGILEIAVAIELRKRIEGEVWLIIAGVASIVFGVLMIVLPIAGVLALAWLIGVYALLFGGVMIALSLRLRRVAHPAPRTTRKPLVSPTIQPV